MKMPKRCSHRLLLYTLIVLNPPHIKLMVESWQICVVPRLPHSYQYLEGRISSALPHRVVGPHLFLCWATVGLWAINISECHVKHFQTAIVIERITEKLSVTFLHKPFYILTLKNKVHRIYHLMLNMQVTQHTEK